MYWCNFDLFTYCIFIFWAFDTAITFVIFAELDPINFFLMNMSFWHVMLMKGNDAILLLQVLHIQPLCVGKKYSQL